MLRKHEGFSDTAKSVAIYRQVLAAVSDFAAAARRLEEVAVDEQEKGTNKDRGNRCYHTYL